MRSIPIAVRTVLWMSVIVALLVLSAVPASAIEVREPAAAGRFYPADPVKLLRAVNFYLAHAEEPDGKKPLAIIAPHAGYVYSGQICADAWRQAGGHDYDRVVILGTNHTVAGFSGVSILPGGVFRTPLGDAKIDERFSAELAAADPEFSYRAAVHRQEHSVEVQVPFAQVLFPDTPLVVAVLGADEAAICDRFGRALAEAVKDRSALIVASTDLSHYPSYEDARRVDRAVLEAAATMDPDAVRREIGTRMAQGVANLSTCACGAAPMTAAMTAARHLGAKGVRIVSYANSGDALVGRPDRVVGYGAVAFSAFYLKRVSFPEPPPADEEAPLTESGKKALLFLARTTIAEVLKADALPLPRSAEPALNAARGAFVTLKKDGQLRGCIGHMAADRPLQKTVGAMAVQAAFKDRRFSPVSAGELEELEIEISVLTPYEPVPGPEAIRIGTDGVVLKKAGKSAVFLPQVAVEQGWKKEEVLDHLCRKAGLPAGAWKEGAQLMTFQATVFSEREYGKRPVERW
ncbi:MAG: AmmeMemoRadiSam system protein B [Desulfobacterales bacterium]|nr:AmmeMemoRadiSam system protein B [Desulfobacterales bacterium]